MKVCDKLLEEMKKISAINIEKFVSELNGNALMEGENEKFMTSIMFSKNICSKCKTKTSDWKIFEQVERNFFTQSTSFGGKEETYDITYRITACPKCGFEILREETKREFVSTGWIK